MRQFVLSVASLAAAIAAAQPAWSANEIAADRNPIAVGQAVTLHWYFTGEKVVVSGGRFGAGTVVTGRTSLTDRPNKTTRYTFDAYYKGQAKAAAGESPKSALVHAHYSIVVEVYNPRLLGLKPYVDPHGWQVSYIKTWRRDAVPLPDPANNALVYFQQEEDSVERLAVAILPTQEASVDSLLRKIQADLPSHYDQVEMAKKVDTTFMGMPAIEACFTGIDNSHPGVKTQTCFLAFTHAGHAYIISGRTAASRFAQRETLLTCMVKSFDFKFPTASASRL